MQFHFKQKLTNVLTNESPSYRMNNCKNIKMINAND